MKHKDYNIFGHTFFQSLPGELGPDPLWVCYYGSHMQTSNTLIGLLWEMIWEYKRDKHLVG